MVNYSILLVVSLYFVLSIWIYIDVRKSLTIAFMSDGTYKEEYSKYIDERTYLRMNPKYAYAKDEITNKQLHLGLGAPIHNFLSGTVWLKYTYSGGSHGSSDVPIKVKVILERGFWKTVSVFEEP